MKLLSIIMQSACVARAGNVTRSKLYKSIQYLTYEDVVLTLPENCPLSVQHMREVFTLRCRKSHK